MNSNMPTFDAIVFPADDRPPHIVPLMISALSLPASSSAEPYRCGRAPHPEVYMDYIADQLGSHAWRYHVRLISSTLIAGRPANSPNTRLLRLLAGAAPCSS